MTHDSKAHHDLADDPAVVDGTQPVDGTADVAREQTVLDDLELGPRVAEWLARAS